MPRCGSLTKTASPALKFSGPYFADRVRRDHAHRDEMRRLREGLRDAAQLRVEERAGEVGAGLDVGRERRAPDGDRHLLGDVDQRVADDLEGDRIHGGLDPARAAGTMLGPCAVSGLRSLRDVLAALTSDSDTTRLPIFVDRDGGAGRDHGRAVHLLDDRGPGEAVARQQLARVVDVGLHQAAGFAEIDLPRRSSARARRRPSRARAGAPSADPPARSR